MRRLRKSGSNAHAGGPTHPALANPRGFAANAGPYAPAGSTRYIGAIRGGTHVPSRRIRPRPFYNTRHTYISEMLDLGARPLWVARRTGTSLDMVERHYGRPWDTVADLDAMIGDASSHAERASSNGNLVGTLSKIADLGGCVLCRRSSRPGPAADGRHQHHDGHSRPEVPWSCGSPGGTGFI